MFWLKTHFLKIENHVESKNETFKKFVIPISLLLYVSSIVSLSMVDSPKKPCTVSLCMYLNYKTKAINVTIHRKSVIRFNTHVIIVCRIRSYESAHSAEIRPRGWPWNRLKTRLSNAQSQSTSQQSPTVWPVRARRDAFYNILLFRPHT